MNNQDTGSNVNDQSHHRRWLFALIPLAIFLILAGFFYKQLAMGGASNKLPSALIGQPVPQASFEPLPGLTKNGEAVPAFSPQLFASLEKDQLAIVNIWASWCAPCRLEHPLLIAMGNSGRFKVFGINYKDKPANALRFLGQLGNPYDGVGVDPKGRGAIDWGVYGIPETFVVDGNGIIVAKHPGPLTGDVYKNTILPLLKKPSSQ